MNFRTIDSIFNQAKKIISGCMFVTLIMSVLFFLYWLITSMKIVLPGFINGFFLFWINIVNNAIKETSFYKSVTMLLPLIVSVIFIVLTYLLNCVMVYVEQCHSDYKKYVENYKANLEKTINMQLRRNFINELSRTNYFLTKMRLQVKTLNSYLHEPLPEEECKKIEDTILRSILNAMGQPYVINKGMDGNSIYFICNDMRLASEFYTHFVAKSIAYINKHIQEKISINFYCAVDVFDFENEIKFKLMELDKILDLRVRNKILVSPRFKVYYQELYPGYFVFKLLGEYNFSKTSYRSQFVNIYTLHRHV